MNAFDDLLQAAKDMGFHGTNYYSNYYSNASIEARERAEKACRELFPPMAKPLAWIDENYGGGVQSQTFLGFYYDIAPMRENFIAHFGDNGSSSRIGVRFDTIEGAKAACEAHHQARFLELLA